MEQKKLFVFIVIVSFALLASCKGNQTFKPSSSHDRQWHYNCILDSNHKIDEYLDNAPYYQVGKIPSLDKVLIKGDYNQKYWIFPQRHRIMLQSQESEELLHFFDDSGQYLHTTNIHFGAPSHSHLDHYNMFENPTLAFDTGEYLAIIIEKGVFIINWENPKLLPGQIRFDTNLIYDSSIKNKLYLTLTEWRSTENLLPIERAKTTIMSCSKDTGKIDWKTKVDHGFYDFSPKSTLHEIGGFSDILLIEHDYVYSCIEKNTGNVVWQKKDLKFSNYSMETFKDENDNNTFYSKNGVLYASRATRPMCVEYRPLFNFITTTLYAVSVHTGQTLWKLEYPGVHDSCISMQTIDNERMYLFVPSGIFVVSHNKGILKGYKEKDIGFGGVSAIFNGKVFLSYLKAPQGVVLDSKIDQKDYKNNFTTGLMCFDLENWKKEWSTDFTKNVIYCQDVSWDFVLTKPHLNVLCVIENRGELLTKRIEKIAVEYKTGKIISRELFDGNGEPIE
jgi:outer membrane protein assembly factor BamB